MNSESEFLLECIKREMESMSRGELEQRIYDLFVLTRKQSEHIQTLNLLIANLEEQCKRMSFILETFS
jgi:uncharacterized coiled-coil protein SlyX